MNSTFLIAILLVLLLLVILAVVYGLRRKKSKTVSFEPKSEPKELTQEQKSGNYQAQGGFNFAPASQPKKKEPLLRDTPAPKAQPTPQAQPAPKAQPAPIVEEPTATAPAEKPDAAEKPQPAEKPQAAEKPQPTAPQADAPTAEEPKDVSPEPQVAEAEQAAPKAEETKAEETKAEEVKAEEVKAEEAKAEEAKADQSAQQESSRPEEAAPEPPTETVNGEAEHEPIVDGDAPQTAYEGAEPEQSDEAEEAAKEVEEKLDEEFPELEEFEDVADEDDGAEEADEDEPAEKAEVSEESKDSEDATASEVSADSEEAAAAEAEKPAEPEMTEQPEEAAQQEAAKKEAAKKEAAKKEAQEAAVATAGVAAAAEAALAESVPRQEVREPATEQQLDEIAPASGRIGRLRGRLARSQNVFGQSVLGMLSAGELDEDAWEEIEDELITADLGQEITLRITDELRDMIAERGVASEAEARAMLREVLVEAAKPEMDRSIKAMPFEGKPAVILVVGVNGTGKTTTTGKLARVLVSMGHSVVLGAADTFRAAAADQLETWGRRVGARTVRGAEGADPASVAFDAVAEGVNNGADVVLIDTAGRLHNSANLMDQLAKVKRVVEKKTQVDEVLLVLDATTGQNGMLQAKAFREVVDITGVVLTKLDGSAKGGIVFRVQEELGVPVKLVGLGEGADDLAPFEVEGFVDALLGTNV